MQFRLNLNNYSESICVKVFVGYQKIRRTYCKDVSAPVVCLMSMAETDPLCSGPWPVWSIQCFQADTGVYRIGPWDPVSQLGCMWFFLPLSSPQYSGWLSFHHCLLVVSMTPLQLSWWSLRTPRVQWGVKVPLQFFICTWYQINKALNVLQNMLASKAIKDPHKNIPGGLIGVTSSDINGSLLPTWLTALTLKWYRWSVIRSLTLTFVV